MYELIIFDFDDTLLHLGISWGEVKKEVIHLAKKEGIEVDDRQHLIRLSNTLADTPERKKTIDAIYEKYERQCVERKCYAVFPGIPELIRALKAKGYQLAIASGNHSSSIRAIVDAIGLLSYFDFICGRDCVEKNKPAPDQPLHIMEKLGASKEKTLFIGNSQFDELAAAAAGVAFIRFQPGKGDSPDSLEKQL